MSAADTSAAGVCPLLEEGGERIGKRIVERGRKETGGRREDTGKALIRKQYLFVW